MEVQAYILVLGEAPRQAVNKIAHLEQRVNELEARLKRHSRNSLQPPFQDPPQAPQKTKREPSGRSPWGQLGHQGNHRQLVPPEKVDKIIEYRLEACQQCQNMLQESTGGQSPAPKWHQAWELWEIRPHLTEHPLLSGWCPLCQVWVKPALPPDVSRNAFGPRLQA